MWNTIKGVTVESLGDNRFIFHFHSNIDKKRILRAGPWHFNNSLITLVEPQGPGDISKIHFTKTPFWVQIHNSPIINITQPLQRVLVGKLFVEEGDVIMLPLLYERLPEFWETQQTGKVPKPRESEQGNDHGELAHVQIVEISEFSPAHSPHVQQDKPYVVPQPCLVSTQIIDNSQSKSRSASCHAHRRWKLLARKQACSTNSTTSFSAGQEYLKRHSEEMTIDGPGKKGVKSTEDVSSDVSMVVAGFQPRLTQ
ncbi:hypothetical protein WN943_027851 [Citrus x changshan-huyou]